MQLSEAQASRLRHGFTNAERQIAARVKQAVHAWASADAQRTAVGVCDLLWQ